MKLKMCYQTKVDQLFPKEKALTAKNAKYAKEVIFRLSRYSQIRQTKQKIV